MAGIQAKRETLVWTDDEVELLLRVTLDYKTTKLQENVNWESCQSKYSDIMDAFLAQYPRHPTNKDFPHEVNTITKAQVTAKVKNIRSKFRLAVETGRRCGQGRVVLLFFELLEEIWGKSFATRSIDAGFETGDLEETSSMQSSSPTLELSTDSPHSIESRSSLPSNQRKDVFQAKLTTHRSDRPKRKLPTDPAVQEDLRIKKKMLEIMEESARRNADNMQQINRNIANITSIIQEGFSLMRQLLVQPPSTYPHSTSSGYGQCNGHSPAFIHKSPPLTTPASLGQEDLKQPHIKEEHVENDITEFTASSAIVKSEDDDKNPQSSEVSHILTDVDRDSMVKLE
ncbi:uncharacterized protein LOC121656825 [Melanotaenia boesemani]|uniref:uncharacterized protein LOC121656825 n=1 Tax=Melanotaenia boesemani TaxID=1250792 RepID=UPI001C05497D|nr:uncharacterized protein LOC121656825 [Melanotaenia boesemani]